MKLTLPYPPSANRYWRNYRGNMVKSIEAKRYAEKVFWLARAAGMSVANGADVAVSVDVYRPRRRTGNIGR